MYFSDRLAVKSVCKVPDLFAACRLAFPSDLVEVFSALLEVADAAVVVEVAEVVEFDVGDEGGFGVVGGLGDNGLVGEGEVAGGEDGGLGVLDVHVADFGQKLPTLPAIAT